MEIPYDDPEQARRWVIGTALFLLDELEDGCPGEGEAARRVLVSSLSRWEPLARTDAA